jgi:chlorophyllide a oxygenase
VQVESALEDGRDEYQSIATTKAELVALQEEVELAGQRLRLTRARVDQNVKRLTELKAEAAKIERMNVISAEAMASFAHSSSHPEAHSHGQNRPFLPALSPATGVASGSQASAMEWSTEGSARGSSTGVAVLQHSTPPRVSKKSRGLGSTLNLEPGLRNFWCAPWQCVNHVFFKIVPWYAQYHIRSKSHSAEP